MALTPNQITDVFQSQLGRAPTPYEISNYSNASIQDLTGLKNTYSSYKPNQSVVDYLKYNGQDSSSSALSSLATKYGINNYTGSYDQNTALLKSLQGGQTPPPPAPVTGSIVPPTTTTTTAPPPGGGTFDAAKYSSIMAANGQNNAGQPLTGTVAGAAGSTTDGSTPDTTTSSDASTPSPDSNTPPVSPDVENTKTAYTQAQQAVIDVTSQISDINDAINSALQNKRDEISRSGGVVDESQLRSTVLAENAPLLAERNSLTAQRTQLVGEQNIAAKNYQDAVNAQKESDANFYKSQTVAQGQEKINQTDTKMTDQETQFAEKLAQSGWKSAKVNVYDPAGNVIGNKVVWTQDPGTAATDNATASTTTTSGVSSVGAGGISDTAVTNVGNTATLPPLTLADGATPAQVMNTLISGAPVYVKGTTTPISQQDLYNMAVQDMLGATSTVGGRTPSGAILAVKDKETQIMNAYGLTPYDVSIAKTQFKNLSSANASLLQTASFINTYASTATDNLNLALTASANVPRTGAKIVNNFAQWAQGNFTPAGNLAQFETYIYTAAREYAKVTSGGAQSSAALTDIASAQADKLINASQSPQAFQAVVAAMKNDMSNVTSEFDKQTSSFPDQVKALYGMASATPTLMRSSLPSGTSGDKQFVESALTRQGYNYDNLMSEMNASIPPGTQPALDNSTGDPVYATPQDIKNGLATPL